MRAHRPQCVGRAELLLERARLALALGAQRRRVRERRAAARVEGADYDLAGLDHRGHPLDVVARRVVEEVRARRLGGERARPASCAARGCRARSTRTARRRAPAGPGRRCRRSRRRPSGSSPRRRPFRGGARARNYSHDPLGPPQSDPAELAEPEPEPEPQPEPEPMIPPPVDFNTSGQRPF